MGDNIEIKEETLEDVLDVYFPKGDSRRGDALVLFAYAYSKMEKMKKEFNVIKNKMEELWQNKF